MVIFGYDGTLNGDWVAHYAVRFALHSAERRLLLVHVLEDARSSEAQARIDRIGEECRIAGVELESRMVSKGRSTVSERLAGVATTCDDVLLVTGTRARPRNLSFLAGTVSARLLGDGRFPVVALRVVHPGILGQPRRMLLPLAGHPRGARFALPLLRRFGPEIEQLQILYVREISRLRFRLLRAGRAEHLLREGRAFATRVEEDVARGLGLEDLVMDAAAVVSDDAAQEILIYAGRYRSRLICLGASERSLPERLVYGNPIEQVLRGATCDVAVYRSVE